MMNGNHTWIKKDLLSYIRMSKKINDPKVKTQLEGNINKLRKYCYVTLGIVKSTLDVCIVPKVDNVRPVHNGANSGLNEAIWIS